MDKLAAKSCASTLQNRAVADAMSVQASTGHSHPDSSPRRRARCDILPWRYVGLFAPLHSEHCDKAWIDREARYEKVLITARTPR